MKTIGLLILASSLFAVPVQAKPAIPDGVILALGCDDDLCTKLAIEVSDVFVRLSIKRQRTVFSAICTSINKAISTNSHIPDSVGGCTFVYNDEHIVWTNAMPDDPARFTKIEFDLGYLIALPAIREVVGK